MPLVLRQFYHNRLQDVNLRNFSRGQTNLDRLRDGLVGAQVLQGYTRCHHWLLGSVREYGGPGDHKLVKWELSYHSNPKSAMTWMLGVVGATVSQLGGHPCTMEQAAHYM